MVKVVRKIGKKIDFDSVKSKSLVIDEERSEIRETFSEIKKSEEALSKIQKIQAKGILGKEKRINQKQVELKRMINLWKDLNKINLEELRKSEIISVVNSQKKFIKDLLKHHIISIKEEKEYIQKIKKF